jgi:hypothetical protein
VLSYLNMRMYMFVCMCGMYVHVCVSGVRVCMYCDVCMYICIYVCTYIHMYVCIYVCMYVCMYVCTAAVLFKIVTSCTLGH